MNAPLDIRVNKTIEDIETETLKNRLVTPDRIYSLIETENGRIAIGFQNGSISINTLKITRKKWVTEIYKENAHYNSVKSLCTLSSKRLLSGSDDCSIKVWNISKAKLTLLKTIQKHTLPIWKVISLSKERFASCSDDCSVKIWKDNNQYQNLSTLKDDGNIISILQLRNKDILVSCSNKPSHGISFWNIQTYSKIGNVQGYGINWSTHMTEFPNGNIGLVSGCEPFPIVIIDGNSQQVITVIILNNNNVVKGYSLYIFNQSSFLCVGGGTLVQISSIDYSILFKSKGIKFKGNDIGGDFNGFYGMILFEGGNYLVVEYNKQVTLIKPFYYI